MIEKPPANPDVRRTRPSPIDARGPRFNQGVLAVALIIGFVFDVRLVVPIWAVVLVLSATTGSQYGPFLRLYRSAIQPRLGPPKEVEDPRPPRFAAAVGTAFLTVATVSLLAGTPGVAWALSLIVAALAALAAVTGLCVGCEIYVWFKRHSRTGWDDVTAGGPAAGAVA